MPISEQLFDLEAGLASQGWETPGHYSTAVAGNNWLSKDPKPGIIRQWFTTEREDRRSCLAVMTENTFLATPGNGTVRSGACSSVPPEVFVDNGH